jgi:hypothetical protein
MSTVFNGCGIVVLAVKERREQADQTRAESINLSIRNLLLAEITDSVLSEAPVIKELANRIRSEFEVIPLRKREAYTWVAGVDAGSQVIPLASMQYAVISALVYVLPQCKRFYLPPESMCEPYSLGGGGFAGSVNLRREAKLYETAHAYLLGGGEVELMLVDGPLALSGWWGASGCEKDRRRLVDALNGFLKVCRERGVNVAGVVKRPSARYLVHYLGLEGETNHSDSYLMHQTLMPGERTDIFSPRTALRIASKGSQMMDLVQEPVYSFYCRFTRDWDVPPIRVDLPAFCLGSLDDVADHCYATGFWSGIPLPIVRADEEVKVSRRFISDVFSEIICRVGRETGDVSPLAPYWGEGDWMAV